MLTLWYLNPNWTEHDAMSIATYITDKDNGFIPPYVGEFGDRWYTSILKPSSSSSAQSLNNIYSIQLMVTGVSEYDIVNYEGEGDGTLSASPLPNNSMHYGDRKPSGNIAGGSNNFEYIRLSQGNQFNSRMQLPESTPHSPYSYEYGDEMYNPPFLTDLLTISPDFQINDITIIYRSKNAN